MSYRDDDIDIIGVIEAIWRNKLLMAVTVFLSLIIGIVFLNITEKKYVSKIIFTVGIFPPGYNEVMVVNDFQRMFSSEELFKKYKINNKTILKFSDFNNTNIVDGYVFSTNRGKKLVNFDIDIRDKYIFGDPVMLIKSNNLQLLNEIYKYSGFINDTMKKTYNIRIANEIDRLATTTAPQSIQERGLSSLTVLRNYMEMVNDGNILYIYPPNLPNKVYPSTRLILSLSALIGFLIGLAAMVLRYYTFNRDSKS